MTTDTTSAGMPPIAASHDALDVPPVQTASTAIKSLAGEAKSQVSSTLVGLSSAVREVAAKLESNGAAPLARYVHDAADTVAGWSSSVDRRSVDDLAADTRTLVRTSPALAVALALAAGFALSRVVRSSR